MTFRYKSHFNATLAKRDYTLSRRRFFNLRLKIYHDDCRALFFTNVNNTEKQFLDSFSYTSYLTLSVFFFFFFFEMPLGNRFLLDGQR